MGIKGLTALLAEQAPECITEHDIKTLFGRKVAIDASMSIYQFLIAVRQQDGELLTNDAGETTSHLMGLFYRTIRIVENGIKPAYVFDGKPPDLKKNLLGKRFEKREEAKEDGDEAKEVGTAQDVEKFSRRTVKVTKEHNEECRRLLKLMGIPFVIAPSEAEAQCAELARGGKVFAAGSEDMDTLTFGAPLLYRHLTFSETKKAPIAAIDLPKALAGLKMNMTQFIDLCILLGCDYLEPIKGVGPKSALKLIREHGDLAKVLDHLKEKVREKMQKEVVEDEVEEEEDVHQATENEDRGDVDEDEDEDEKDEEAREREEKARKEKEQDNKKKKPKKRAGGISVPEFWPWEEAKRVFEKPDVTPASELDIEWTTPDVPGLVQFLVTEKGFNEDRVRKGADKLAKHIASKQQGRLDGFFIVKAKEPRAAKAKKGKDKDKDAGKGKDVGKKRKAEEEASSSKKKAPRRT